MAESDKNYFTQETEDAIIAYNNSTSQLERDKIYKEKLHYPFHKMAQSILNVFEFKYFDVSKEDVISEVLSFFIQKMHLYDGEKGKAFFYFSRIAKNYLIQLNNGNYKRFKNTLILSEMPESWDIENSFTSDVVDSEYEEFTKLMLAYWDKNLHIVFDNKRDIQIADAVLDLFRRSKYVENFNKKYLYFVIREMTDHRTHYITRVISTMRRHQKKILNEYLENGTVTSPPYLFFQPDSLEVDLLDDELIEEEFL